MKNHLLVLTIALLMSQLSFSQTSIEPDTSWKKGGFIGLTFNQASLSNWAQGGENSVALSSTLNLFANYLKDKIDWQNSIDLAYAMVQTGSDALKKSDDKIDFTSKYSRKFADHWLYGILFNFKSQFAEGFNYPNDSMIVSKFFAPAYITLSPGLTWKPLEYFEVLVSPATAKWTFVNDNLLSDVGAYGVDPGESTRFELGAYLNMKFKKDILENVNYTMKLELFNNYIDEDKDNVKNVDVNWENALQMKINKYLTASIYAQLIYDADVVEKTQFKETIGVGFGYKL
jgi:hypothetical protein